MDMKQQQNYSSTKLKPVIRDYGCRNHLPHDLSIKVYDGERLLVEQCKLCGKKVRFLKHFKGRTDNRAYLEAHSRNFAQRGGRTHRLYMKIYHPDECIIVIP